jgi:hypothetical protein
MKCKICNQELKNLLALSTHIQFKHENKKKEYYDLYMKKDAEGLCKTCKSPTNFRIFSTGYEVYCCKECERVDYSSRMKSNNPMKNQKSKDNQRKTNQRKYGVNQNTQRPEIKEKIKETNKKLYEVENVIQVKKFQSQAKKNREKTCLEETGFQHYFMVPEVKEKIKNTNIKIYGSPCVLTSKYGIAKSKETCFRKYGAEFPTQNKEIFEKAQKTAGWAKPFKNLYYRGSYELDFLEKYYDLFEIKQGLIFDYNLDQKNHKYYSDFYIPDLNLIVEIKNIYAYNKHKKQVKTKKAAVLAAGYNFVMIINKDYKEFEKLLLL